MNQIFSMPIDPPEGYKPIVARVGKMNFDLKSCVLHYFELTSKKGFNEDWNDFCIHVFRDVSDMVTSYTDCTLEEIEEDMDIAREMMDFVFSAIGTKFECGEA